jgi:hypothetical protein
LGISFKATSTKKARQRAQLKPTCARADDGRSGAHPEMVRAQVRYDIVSISFRQKGFGKG